MFLKPFPSSLQLSLRLNTLLINKSTVWLESVLGMKNIMPFIIKSSGQAADLSMHSAFFQNQDNLSSTTAKFGLYSSSLLMILIFMKAFSNAFLVRFFPCWLFTLSTVTKVRPYLHGLVLKGLKCIAHY